MAGKQLKFNNEQVGWLNDILQDYEAMIITAKNTMSQLKESWEELFSKADISKPETQKLVADLEGLKVDEKRIIVAEQRWKELQNIIFEYLGIENKDAKENKSTGDAGADTIGDEQIHSTNEDEETVSV